MSVAEQIDSVDDDRPFSLLVVDDNEMNRDLLLRRLGNSGFQLSSASNGEEAVCNTQDGTLNS